MHFSLNELEATGKRAARGAGLSFGLAEEAGKALRWLAAQGLPGPTILASHLAWLDGRSYRDLVPISTARTWRAPLGALCPLIAGAALADRAAAISAGRTVLLGPVRYPLLLTPFVAGVAKATGVPISLAWNGLTATLDDCVQLAGDQAAIEADQADAVCCRRAPERPRSGDRPMQGATVDLVTWERLQAFAQRTFAPATDASRTAGAGGGSIDQD